MPLNTASNLRDSDAFYQALVDAYAGLTAELSADLNARLVLLLANHIGDDDVLIEAIAAARAAPATVR